MFILNMKMNSKLICKIIFIILLIFIFIMVGFGIYKIFFFNTYRINDHLEENKVNVIKSENYTNILQTVHNNIDDYLGIKVKMTGFVYRLYDFSNEQFVLGRQMIISSDFQAVIVGFLCNLNEADKYKDGCWIEIEGIITKGEYHGEIPVIEIYKIKEVSIPNDEYVYPPSENYVATSTI